MRYVGSTTSLPEVSEIRTSLVEHGAGVLDLPGIVWLLPPY